MQFFQSYTRLHKIILIVFYVCQSYTLHYILLSSIEANLFNLSYVLPEPNNSVHRGPRLNLMPSKRDMKREKFTVLK